MRSTFTKTVTLVLAGTAAGLFAACGSRSTLDGDGSNAADAGDLDVAVTADAQDAAAADAGIDVNRDTGVDARPGTPIDCAICVAQSCGAPILACVTNPSCAATFQCVATTCLAGGKLDPACLIKCASGDPAGALQIFQIFQCLTTKCGPDCQSVLGLLGGGGGPGTDAGKKPAAPPTPGGADGDQAREDFLVVFSRWPELVSRADPPQKR